MHKISFDNLSLFTLFQVCFLGKYLKISALNKIMKK